MTEREQQFVDDHLVDLNATRACIRAGYSARNADKIGPALLGKTREAIQARQKQLEKLVHMSQEKWIRRIEWLSRANIKKIMS